MRSLSLPTVTYLSFDAVTTGVGASQVAPYVSRLARRGVDVELHSFEPGIDEYERVRAQLLAAGVRWKPHRFGGPGAAGGVGRVTRGVGAVRGASLVHARAHLAGAAAVLARCPRWVWDVRALWSEQRIEQGLLRRGSGAERTLRRFERWSARACTGVVTLSAAAIPALEARTGCAIAHKARVISTCVDLDAFKPAPLPSSEPVRLLASGTFNLLYDVPAMVAFVERMAARRPAVLQRVGPGGSPWEGEFEAAGVQREERPFADMPSRLVDAHAGLCILRKESASAGAATPTKVAEFLACGRPVVVSAGLGDLPPLLEEGRCGVVLAGTTEDALDAGADQLAALLDDPLLPDRCRTLAEHHFDLDAGVATLIDLYRAVAAT
ncbi:MAG: glycosyltransferase [Acidimicrobiia bacterium]|nr:glycosyltransferase [Acidimicrobiia bacterium]